MTALRRRTGLFLGIDPYVLRACERAELDAIVVVGAGARDFGLHSVPEWATPVLVDDQSSIEAVLTGLARTPGLDGRIDFVHTTDERALVCAAAVAQALGARGLDPATAVRFRDKSVQKRIVGAAGLRTARSVVIDDLRTLDVRSFELPGRSVLKPVAGAGTSLTTIVESHADLVAAVHRARTTAGGPRTFILEEFVPAGRELLADGVVIDGEPVFVALGAYEQPCLLAVSSQQRMQTVRLDPSTDGATYTQATPVVRRALAALGLRDGVFHMELFHDADSGGVWFSECAARRGGGLIHEEVAHKFAVDLGDAALRAAAGLAPALEPVLRRGVVGSTFLPQREGILLGCPSAEDLCERPSVQYARIELPVGFPMRGSVSDTIGRVGQVMHRAPTVEAFRAASDATVAWFDERLSVLPTSLTPAELRSPDTHVQNAGPVHDAGPGQRVAARGGSVSVVDVATDRLAGKRLLVLGTWDMREAALASWADAGIEVMLVDGHASSRPGPAARRVNLDVWDSAGAGAEQLRDLASTEDGVVTLAEFCTLTAARVADCAGMHGPSIEAAEIARDKVALRRRLAACGVAGPAFAEVRGAGDVTAFFDAHSGPAVLKPADSAGSTAVFAVASASEAIAALPEALRWSFSGRAILEAFIDGAEFSVEAVVEDGVADVVAIVEKATLPQGFVEFRHIIPAGLKAAESERLTDAAAEVVAALEIENAIIHAEFRQAAAGFTLIEIAVRPAGGLIPDLLKLATGFDLYRAQAALALGVSEPRPVSDLTSECAGVQFVTALGTVTHALGVDASLRDHPALHSAGQLVETGSEIAALDTNGVRAGFVMARAENREQLFAALDAGARDLARQIGLTQ